MHNILKVMPLFIAEASSTTIKPQPPVPPATLDYIQDGLIFEVDGTDKQASGSYCWVDKVGGMRFTNAGSVEELDNGFRFDGTSTSYLKGNSFLSTVNYNTCTIEVVFKSTLASGQWAPIAMFSNWGSGSSYVGVAALYSSHVNYTHSVEFVAEFKDGTTKAYSVPSNTLMTASIKSNQPIVANLELYSNTSSTSRASISNKHEAHIGGRVDGSNVVSFRGDIYAVRVYNRLLTEEEILHNQSIDIQKYNITV